VIYMKNNNPYDYMHLSDGVKSDLSGHQTWQPNGNGPSPGSDYFKNNRKNMAPFYCGAIPIIPTVNGTIRTLAPRV
jgi:hypothetical protein